MTITLSDDDIAVLCELLTEPTAGSFRVARLYHQPKRTEGPVSVVRAGILLRQRTTEMEQEYPFLREA